MDLTPEERDLVFIFGKVPTDEELASLKRPAENEDDRELKRRLDQVLQALPSDERERARAHFGIPDSRTPEEVAHAFKEQRERTRRLEAKVMSKLQHPIRQAQIEGFKD